MVTVLLEFSTPFGVIITRLKLLPQHFAGVLTISEGCHTIPLSYDHSHSVALVNREARVPQFNHCFGVVFIIFSYSSSLEKYIAL